MQDWTPVLPLSGKPRYLELADQIARDLSAGILVPGDRLPPQRRLAQMLSLDFTTISRGYAEAQSRGLVESHVGRGTFVRGAEASSADPRRAASVDLSMNLPPEPTSPDLIARMQNGLAAVSANLVSLLRYQSPAGNDVDKEAASSWLSMRGMVPSLERIAISAGAHPAMMAILLNLTQPGDTVLCEAITYPGLRTISARLGLRLVGLPTDAQGILPDALDAAIRAHAPRALYLNPTLHNPTTLTIPADRRMEIADVLIRHGLPLIEDDAYGFIPAHAPAPLATAAPDLVWHIGGLAKCIGAGLRLAYVVVPNSRAALAFVQTLQAMTVMASPLTMALATRWIQDGTADHIRRFIRAETAARQSMARDLLGQFTFAGGTNAFNIWLSLPPGCHRAALISQMAGHGIGIMPSDGFTVTGRPQEQVRLCLGGRLTRDDLRSELEFLAHMLEDSALRQTGS